MSQLVTCTSRRWEPTVGLGAAPGCSAWRIEPEGDVRGTGRRDIWGPAGESWGLPRLSRSGIYGWLNVIFPPLILAYPSFTQTLFLKDSYTITPNIHLPDVPKRTNNKDEWNINRYYNKHIILKVVMVSAVISFTSHSWRQKSMFICSKQIEILHKLLLNIMSPHLKSKRKQFTKY